MNESGEDLPDGWWERAESIAGHCARTLSEYTQMTYRERVDAALDGIVAEVGDNGWPRDDEPFDRLFRAGRNMIKHCGREVVKHDRHWSYWYDTPGIADAVGEAVTDRIAVHEVCHAFTDAEWEAVWALARVMARGGGPDEAAALLDVPKAVFLDRLGKARKRARALWIAPGETPPRRYVAAPARKPGKLSEWGHNRRASVRAAERRMSRLGELVTAVTSDTASLADVNTLVDLCDGVVPHATIRSWVFAGHLVQRGTSVEGRKLYSIDEFMKVAVARGRMGRPAEPAA